jgi:hypothetical protein
VGGGVFLENKKTRKKGKDIEKRTKKKEKNRRAWEREQNKKQKGKTEEDKGEAYPLVLPREEENPPSNPVISPSPSLAAKVSFSLHHFFTAMPGATTRFPHRHHTTPP